MEAKKFLDLKKFREKIEELEKEQKLIKPQRKTVHFTGTRTIDTYDAFCKVQSNKEELRCMYAAYNLIRGKNFNVTENCAKPLDAETFYKEKGYHLRDEFVGKHPLVRYLSEINDYLKEFGYEIPTVEVTRKGVWSGEYKEKIFDTDNYEKIICVSE